MKTILISTLLFLKGVLGEVCDIGSNIYVTSDEYSYIEGCYEYSLGISSSRYRHYYYTPGFNEALDMIIEWDEDEGGNRALLQDERLMCTMPDYSGGIVSGDAVFEPCVDLDTFEETGGTAMDNFEEIPGKSVSVTFTCGCELPQDLELCNFQLSGGDDNLRDTASAFYTEPIDGCYYPEYDLSRHFMTDGKFPIKYVLDRGENPVKGFNPDNPDEETSPTLVQGYQFEPGNTYVGYYNGDFDLSEFSWVFDLVGAYHESLSYDDENDPLVIYENYAMWSPEEKDNPEEIESWFAMRRDEDGEVFIEDVSNLVSFKCGCSDDVETDIDGDQDGEIGGITSGTIVGHDDSGISGVAFVGFVTILGMI